MLVRSPSTAVISVSLLSPTHKAGRRVGLCCGDVRFDSSHPGDVQQGLLQQNEEELCVHQYEQVITTQVPARGGRCHLLTAVIAGGSSRL